MMQVFKIAACLLFLAGATVAGDLIKILSGAKIVGGQEVDILDYPYQISFQVINDNIATHIHACGGSIIGTRWVLTAAHCTNIQNLLPPGTPKVEMWVRAGSSNHTSGGMHIRVKNYYQHPQYSAKTMDYDISVLELENDFTFGPKIKKIELAPRDYVYTEGAAAKVAGWGLTETTSPVMLHGVNVTTIDQITCAKLYAVRGIKITDNMLCAGERGGKDTCTGDSGGAIVVDGIEIGLTIFGRKCGDSRFPGVYLRVANFRDYIHEKSGI